MDLDIAIKYYSNLADDCRRKASPERYDYMDLKDLAAEHAQLADWLNELKILREKVRTLLEKQEQDGWIPVTERLPEEDGEYLVTYESGYAEDYGFDPIGIAPFEVDCEGFGIWQERFHPVSLGSLGSEWVDIQVTAWRPLEDPYTPPEK